MVPIFAPRARWSAATVCLAGLLGACGGNVGDSPPGTDKPTTQRPGDKPAAMDPTKPAPSDPGDPSGPVATTPAEALPPRAYAAKVKDVLTGLPLEPAELEAVTKDAKAMRGLVDTWMKTDQFRARMFTFWQSAFQQTQLDVSDLDDQIRITSLPTAEQKRMLRAVQESFARTVQALVDEGRPFTETVTTTRFMLNVPMMAALAFMDAAPADDLGKNVTNGFWLLKKHKDFKYVQTANLDPVTGLPVPIPFEDSVNPASPNFMRFVFTQPTKPEMKPCTDPQTNTGAGGIQNVWRALFGARPGCNTNMPAATVFTDEDWNTWRMVNVRKPSGAEERTTFWDVPKLRDKVTTELVLGTSRVGFMTTMAFFANWPTNPSNAFRVTTNQALIVALGHTYDDPDTTVQVSETSDDAQHVTPGTACFGCHQTLDPIRDYFWRSYSLWYSEQHDLANPKKPLPAEGVFTIAATPTKGVGVEGLGRAMAAHPDFGPSWAQKLCHIANGARCPNDSPELKRVVKAWADAKYDWNTLVRELFSSPLVTFATVPAGSTHGPVMTIARREAFCLRLSNRLGVTDACNQSGEISLKKIATQAQRLSLGIPGSAYARADENPVIPRDPNLFFVSGVEKLCNQLAGQLVENKDTGLWKVAEKDAAFYTFVAKIMGVPTNDPRHTALLGILRKHHDAAIAEKQGGTEALRSSFVLACSSPIAASSGL